MPGIIVFKRRWSIGSDDLIVPALILFTVHIVWLIVLSLILVSGEKREWRLQCMIDLHEHIIGYAIILIGCLIVELFIAWVSSRGTILDTEPRSSMQYLLYVRLGILVIEIFWLIMGIYWIRQHYDSCTPGFPRDAILVIIICNFCIIASVFITIWCTFDTAGRSWVKMQRYQNSLKDGQSKYRYKRSGNSHRNWRHRQTPELLDLKRKAMRQYQDSWNRRCELLFCCLGKSDRRQNSFTEIAKLLSEFFRDLDVVPSDVIAGLILTRRQQKNQSSLVVREEANKTYQFLSGLPISPETRFLDVTHYAVVQDIRTLIHYLHYAIAIYGWPIYLMENKAFGCFQLCPYLRCSTCFSSPNSSSSSSCFNPFCCCPLLNRSTSTVTVTTTTTTTVTNQIERKLSASSTSPRPSTTSPISEPMILGDNCCGCNYAALQKICQTHNFEIIYATYHVEIAEPPFFVALDYDKRTIVVTIRGTLSLQDVITDLNAEGDLLPTNPVRDNWLGHKGMVEAAVYIKKKLTDEKILEQALTHNPCKGTHNYSLVLVGHSLGAGTAAILAILLKETYPDLVCYAFSPPGGLLSLPAVEYTKHFITSVVLGKDVVPRLGLHQMETLRFDLINVIKQSKDPKWKTIGMGFCCCTLATETETLNSKVTTTSPDGVNNQIKDDGSGFVIKKSVKPSNSLVGVGQDLISHDGKSKINTINCDDITSITGGEKELSAHPDDSSIALTVHQPLYPPGKIIHIVRNHPAKEEKFVGKKDSVYQALWVDNTEYDQIIISPVMIQDHMPDKVLEALEKLLITTGPPKPTRRLTANNIDHISRPLMTYPSGTITPDSLDRTPSHRVVLETSFTDLQPVGLDLDEPRYMPSYSCSILGSTGRFTSRPPTLLTALRKSRKVDLIRDDWIGMAPLATPEAFSESSSISSRSACIKGGNGINSIGGVGERSTIDGRINLNVSSLKSYSVLEQIDQTSYYLSIKPSASSGGQTNSTNGEEINSRGDDYEEEEEEEVKGDRREGENRRLIVSPGTSNVSSNNYQSSLTEYQPSTSPTSPQLTSPIYIPSPTGSGLDLDPNALFDSLIAKYDNRNKHDEIESGCGSSTNGFNLDREGCSSGASFKSIDTTNGQLNDLNHSEGGGGRGGNIIREEETEDDEVEIDLDGRRISSRASLLSGIREHRINIGENDNSTYSTSSNYCHSLSSMSDSQSSNENLPPLRRSHEEINLNCLEDDVQVFRQEIRTHPTTASLRASDHPDLSPKSRLLFQKLKVIESSADELPACDAFQA
ncbi:diacylglycerol lipase-alpha-like isoform X2 [Panonychus citri]|uniref:diacylglycerol lipase-alpha-like isoform X2 n=1 Tax=Panonychus citri TaxID=50023 RepID=UPI002307AC61|nr:diacylglycerol lipase-alpha-like isoform X2 [Panonychus citri]